MCATQVNQRQPNQTFIDTRIANGFWMAGVPNVVIQAFCKWVHLPLKIRV
jgi:hypothetical protein